MKALIKATIPTVYQLNSLKAFGLNNFIEHLNGRFSAWQEFNTLEEARSYLKNKASNYYEDNLKEVKKHLYKDSLEIDACTAYIEVGEIREDWLNNVM